MGRRSINTTKSGKYMNPTDQFRKEARKRELKKNKKQRIMVRTAVLKGKDPMKLLEEMEVIDRMEYDPMQPPSLNEKVLREKRKKLKETYDRVFKLYEKERPEYAVDLRKANSEYEKTRAQLQQHFDQVRNAERVQLDQIPLPDAPVEMGVPGVIPLPMENIPHFMTGMPMPMNVLPPPSILKKTSAYGPPSAIGPLIPIHIQSQKRRKPVGPPPGSPPELSDSEEEEERKEEEMVDEEYDPEKGVMDELGNVDVDMDPEEMHALASREPQGKSRKIRFADDEDDEEEDRFSEEERRREREERRRRKKEKKRKKREEKEKEKDKSKKKVSALQAMMLKMAGQDTPDFEKEGESKSSTSSDSSPTSESDEDDSRRRRPNRFSERRDEDERIRSKDREIARRREQISRLDDRPPGVDEDNDNPVLPDRLTDAESAAMVAARLAEEAELEAERRTSSSTSSSLATTTTKVPPGPPPGLPPHMAGGGGPQGLPPGPPPGAPRMFMRPPPMRGGPPGAPPRLMPPGPPPGRPQGMPPGPPPGLPPNMRASLMRIPTPMGVPPPRGMMRPPGGGPPPGLHMIPPPQGINPNILSAPPSIRPREGEEGSAPGSAGSGGGQSRVTIQAKPQIKSKMGDVTRFMPMSLKVKRETRDQKGRIRQTTKEEEPRVIGAQAKPQPAPAAQAKTKDDAYDQFMKEMEGLI